MRRRRGNRLGRMMALALLCLAILPLSSCIDADSLIRHSDIYCLEEPNSTYSGIIAQTLPDYAVGWAPRTFTAFQQENTVAVEVADPQALPVLGNGLVGYWYPQYLATVVIAVDRDRTDAAIRGWRDLALVREAVGFVDKSGNEMLLSGMAYGLEGEAYTFAGAVNLLATLRKKGFLRVDSFEVPILITYDYLAAAMKKSGRNMEIIVPCEGTLAYERGLLSKHELSFAGDADTDALLISAGLRLIDGQYDDALYPPAEAYETASRVWDYVRFNTLCLDSDRIFRREVRHTRLYSSADGREHQLFPLIYMIVLIVWNASVFRRAMQKSVRRSAFVTGVILLGWMTARLIKFQIADESILGLYLWYSYYLFQLVLPLVALSLAHAIDRPDQKRHPIWLYALTALNAALIILVFTNHLHGFVFSIDFSKPNWAGDYGYGFGYTMIQIINYSLLGVAMVMMAIKCRRSSRKKSFAYPIAFIGCLVLYGIGYYAKIPIARDSDVTMVTGLFTLLFFEFALRTDLIPMNRRYTAFFTHSTLGMQIADSDGAAVMSSKTAASYSADAQASALALYPSPFLLDDNTLLFANEIRGGRVLWQEDITRLNRLHAQVDAAVSNLAAANAILAEEIKVKRIRAKEDEKERLMAQLEAGIAQYMTKLSSMAQELEAVVDKPRKAASIAILLCYIKRRCNLFFREQETHAIIPGELTGYLDELAEIAGYSNIKIVVSSDVSARLPIRWGTLFYDFFYNVIAWAELQKCPHIMAHFREGNGRVMMRLLPYAPPKTFAPDAVLLETIVSEGGQYVLEDLDDAAVISLSFPRGGEWRG